MNDLQDLQKMVARVALETNVPVSELMKAASLIVQQETGSDKYKMAPSTVQFPYGQGRGMFQFESPKFVKKGGKPGSESAKTAFNRLKNFYKVTGMEAPEWVKKIKEADMIDPAKLTAEQQFQLFFADKMPTKTVINPETKKSEIQFGYSPLSEIMTETYNPVEWWAKYHKRATPSTDDVTRFKDILDSMATATNKSVDKPMQVSYLSEEEILGTPDYINNLGGNAVG